jgi:hypothetical protein
MSDEIRGAFGLAAIILIVAGAVMCQDERTREKGSIIGIAGSALIILAANIP